MTASHDLGEGNFAAFLKAAMRAAQIPTGARLAELAGLNPSIVNRWINNKAIPTIEALRAIAPHLGLPLRLLVVRAGYMTSEEVGLSDDPTPPTGHHSLEDEIRADPRIRKEQKAALIQLIETLFEEDSSTSTDVRGGRSA